MQTVDEVRYSASARNFLKKASPKLKLQIKNCIEGLRCLPPEGDIKTLQGYSDGRKRARVGKYRIIFRYDSDSTLIILSILDIGARGDIYK